MKPPNSRPSIIWLLYLLVGFIQVLSLASADEECPVTRPSDSPVDLGDGIGRKAWYGSEDLAVLIPTNGVWVGMGPSYDYRDKFWLWRRDYLARAEPKPDLSVIATKLDEPESKIETTGGSNALDPYGFGDTMLMLLEFPSSGCWHVRVTYDQSKEVAFVIFVGTDAT